MMVSSVSLSSRNPRVAEMRLKSSCLTPSSPTSSCREIAISIGGRTGGDAQRLEHLGDARLVVGAEDRVAGGPDDAVLQHGLDALARLDRVAVARQQDRRRVLLFLAGSVAIRLP